MAHDFAGRVAVVTGAAGSIGVARSVFGRFLRFDPRGYGRMFAVTMGGMRRHVGRDRPHDRVGALS